MTLQRWEPDFDVRFSKADYDEGNQYWCKAEDVAQLEALYDELEKTNAALIESLQQMIDLSEFWFQQGTPISHNPTDYSVWVALSYESSAYKNARTAIRNAKKIKNKE